jgi:hypothetical protein
MKQALQKIKDQWPELERRSAENFEKLQKLQQKILERHNAKSVPELYEKLNQPKENT